MAKVALQGLRKTYDTGAEILKGIDLEIQDGEFMVFVGPSGCGKSTLMRMIAGLEDITAGELQIGDRRANDLPPAQRGVAMVFQSYALYPHMTVAQNMGFSLKMAGVPAAQIRAQVEKAAAILQISHLLDRTPKAMSGGQRQRVAIGRAIVRQPGVFLFDEPLSNLDASLRVQMRIELTRLHRELGTTMIYVTHDQVEAMTMGDRIAVFHGGRIEQVGTPLELYQQPANTFVAQFLGSPKMNLMPVRVQQQGASLRMAAGAAPGQDWGGDLIVPVAAMGAQGTQGLQGTTGSQGAPTDWSTMDVAQVTQLGVRPENWVVSPVTAGGEGHHRHHADHPAALPHGLQPHASAVGSSPAEPVAGSWQATADVVEHLGDVVLLHGRLMGSEVPVCAKIPALHAHPWQPGETMRLSPMAGTLHLFDAQGQRKASV